MSWAAVMQQWDAAWRALAQEGEDLYAAIQRAPADFEAAFARFYTLLQALRARLDAMRLKLAQLPAAERGPWQATLQALDRRWTELAAGLYGDARETQAPSVGWVPVLMVGTVAFGLSAVSWAVVAWEYLQNLDKQTALVERELDARVALSQQGLALPPSTLPAGTGAAPPPDNLVGQASKALLGGALLLGLFAVLPTVFGLWKRSSS